MLRYLTASRCYARSTRHTDVYFCLWRLKTPLMRAWGYRADDDNDLTTT